MHILPYRSYGTAERLYFMGRVLANQPLPTPPENVSFWRGLRAMWLRLDTKQVPGAHLTIELPNQPTELQTDEDGYFRHHLAPSVPLSETHGWHPFALRITQLPDNHKLSNPDYQNITATAHVLIPPADAEFGVISDIDDTILETDAISTPRMLRNTFLRSYRNRLPFAGVAAFYQSLQVYDLLDDYMRHHGLPTGPLLLRDYGFAGRNLRDDHFAHKTKEISQLLDTYPTLPFVLIGDSGQHDPGIYHEIVQRYPGRIRAIYIRDVEVGTAVSARDTIVRDFAAATSAAGVPMLLVPDTTTAAVHAARIGLIKAGAA
jgi:phosphatidate phosphatase APP1